ncbi:serine hydrolase domain-containing protein [Piscinibacter gummiphilus]|uniref:Serine hydrolase n=1 Tax=Piscinibacter gummiphilus TaxID=946333 RepID=A0ABZ0D0E9_9BURK|nr:serine hydrolase [Piscinibacter gummiphilus]WOB08219.1 serine hydrolase [Piscinibacter gummiphilus]
MTFSFRLGWLLAGGAAIGALAGCTTLSPGHGLKVATSGVSQALCSAVFVSGRDVDQAYREEMRPQGGMWLLDWGLHYELDRPRRQVRATAFGGFPSRAVYRDGMGCLLDNGRIPPAVPARVEAPVTPVLPEIAGPGLVTPSSPKLQAALDAAFDPSWQATKAVVVLHRGRVVAERYAPDLTMHTAWHAHSISKSATHALVGVLALQGRLDPRPLDPLLRMTEGKARFRGYNGFDDATRMWSLEPDMAAYAESRPQEVPPGTRWDYSDPGYMRASKAIRDAVGGTAADVQRFAHAELFGRLGMRSVVMEFDAAGTPVGASHFYGTARDWAKLGLLYLNDGEVGGERLLPLNWARQAATQTLDTGYGAGFWLNVPATSRHPLGFPWGLPGAPADAYFGYGYLGQYLIVVPSQQLVIVRFGLTHEAGGGRVQAGRLVADVIEALAQQNVVVR